MIIAAALVENTLDNPSGAAQIPVRTFPDTDNAGSEVAGPELLFKIHLAEHLVEADGDDIRADLLDWPEHIGPVPEDGVINGF